MRALFLCLLGSVLPGCALTQGGLALPSVNGNPALTTDLNLSFAAPDGVATAAVQWTLTYPADQVASISVSAGPVAAAAQKFPTCAAGIGSYTCIVSGFNATGIQSGVLAVLAVTLGQFARGQVRIDVSGLAASGTATPISLTGGEGIISVEETAVISTTSVPGDALGFGGPRGIAVDSSENVFIADTLDNRILMVTPVGHVSVVAGVGTAGPAGDGGPAIDAQLNQPAAVAVDPAGNIYVADSQNHRVRAFRVGGNITTVAGTGSPGFNTDHVPGAAAQLSLPLGVAVDAPGNLYIADTDNHRIRMVSAADHTITTIAGTGSSGFLGDGGPAANANLSFPSGIAVDSAGDIFIADSGNNRIRELSPRGTILTIAGGVCCGLLGDGGPATAAQLGDPTGLAVDSIGNLYIADSNNNRIRMMSAQDGTIITLAGTGMAGSGPSQLSGPEGVAIDRRGQLYIADTNNNRIQAITLSQGIVSAGSGSGAAGNTVRIPLTLSLNPGISIDSIGVTLLVSPAAGGTLTFTPAVGISPPDILRATADHLVLGWNDDLSSAAQPALAGNILLGTIGVSIPANALVGSAIQISISQVSGDLSQGNSSLLLTVPLLADLAGSLTVTNCAFVVGDVFPLADPQSTNHCGQFGDSQLTFEDVVTALRLWAFPPPVCTDLADALDADPPDDTNANPPVLGGDGLPMDLQDLQVIVTRWGNLDPSRPARPGGSYARFPSCSPAGPPHSVSRQIRPQSSHIDRSARGTLELGAAEISGSAMRVPVYLHTSQSLQGLALAIGWTAPSPVALRFTNGQLPEPSLLDTKIPGLVAVAWLQSLPPAPAARILVGYIEWDIAPGVTQGHLRVYRAEAISNRHTTLALKFDEPNRE